jgi:thioredoxin-dependent peroxiredoxin
VITSRTVGDQTIRRIIVATLQLGDESPNFTAETTAGEIDFHSYLGNGWGVLFSHPADFTPVCTTELGAVAKLVPEFAKRNTKVIAVSVDPIDSHNRWLGDIEDVTGARPTYPLVADPDRAVATSYGMIHPNASTTATVRSVFVIGPDKKVKLTLTYPASTGRDFEEILRVLDSLQLTAAYQVATPADWRAGDDVIITPAVSDADAAVRFPGYTTVKPYLRKTAQPG